VQRGALTALVPAFSRMPHQPKQYVQHRMAEYGARIWAALEQHQGNFYVCGDAHHMAKDVRAELVKIAESHGSMSVEAAERWVEELVKAGRYHTDVWF
jgi:sulfite reductase (NADPH) flavoprotein alpha-component